MKNEMKVVESVTKPVQHPEKLARRFNRGTRNSAITSAIGQAARTGKAAFVSATALGFCILGEPIPFQMYHRVTVNGSSATVETFA